MLYQYFHYIDEMEVLLLLTQEETEHRNSPITH